ncbi:hypothetical protein ONS95_008439 [Cadophora gregata]|uniref:uncharacterized protein n=1 Tax=Cadophora gregata TaxID=51156 RepID=UPI0026DB8608|nr:uncharacterized protein ONS95_008439 [Cadophora gregata]KAK0100491.1 hypothetical protein ONS96_007766 [Cadophora gregata f. sp. sojae]KAK0126861.1 hypothetical protein ONS95_008439 [Cadophora gregata]
MSSRHLKKNVHVLFLTWNTCEPRFVDQTLELQEELNNTFKISTSEHWRIPYRKTCTELLTGRLEYWRESYDNEDSLFILYYSGHGFHDEDGNLGWGAHREEYEDFCLSWKTVPPIFTRTSADILYILDTCFATASIHSFSTPQPLLTPPSLDNTKTGSTTELLASAGFADLTYVPGPYSFTDALIQVLRCVSLEASSYDHATIIPPISILNLHQRVMSLRYRRLREYEEGQELKNTPIFVRLVGDGERPCILLQPRAMVYPPVEFYEELSRPPKPIRAKL